MLTLLAPKHMGEAVRKTLQRMETEQIVHRIWQHDYTVWKEEPEEIANRLNWLHAPEMMGHGLAEIGEVVGAVRQDGLEQALLLGMGGSSLAPEVFSRTLGVRPGYLNLEILDSTHPATVREKEHQFPPEKTLYIVSTKSGGTVETLSFMKYFYRRAVHRLGREEASRRFVAITDPGSGLEQLARELNFRHIFLNDPEVGGRFSALTYFGLVPAMFMGINVDWLLDRAQQMRMEAMVLSGLAEGQNAPAYLGAILGALAQSGRDKLTLIISPGLAAFGAWLEQLIAESTGKEGRGILPVDGEPLFQPEHYREDRLFVYLRLEGGSGFDGAVNALAQAGHPVVQIDLRDTHDLGGEMFRWEFATAVAGWCLGINPFDQPNVEAAKAQARQALEAYRSSGALPEPPPVLEKDGLTVIGEGIASDSPEAALREFLESGTAEADRETPSPYLSIQAYLPSSPEVDQALQELRHTLLTQTRLATTVGYGPRFLHSTGQLHKGDAGKGLFIQITDDPVEDLPIPDTPEEDAAAVRFGTLIRAQALGDYRALVQAGRRVIRLHFREDAAGGIRRLAKALR